jgi:hypothetical protein
MTLPSVEGKFIHEGCVTWAYDLTKKIEKNKSEYKSYLNCAFDIAMLVECKPSIFPTVSFFVSKKIEFYYKISVFLTFFDKLTITFLEIY